jgi:coenzyme F420 hydrogenase subunit delta
MDVHGLSATYPLHDLKDEINIKLIVIQPENVPMEMKMGLSKVLEDNIPQTVNKTIETLNSMLSK